MSTALVLAALLLALRDSRWSRDAATSIYVLALLAKESALVAPSLVAAARL